ncbi:MAG: glycosyltransferase family protein [Bacteroidota bacterium]
MRILYGVQGTGQGHLTRAKEFLPRFRDYGMVDVLVSGGDTHTAQLVPRHQYRGCTLHYDQQGRLSLRETLRQLRPIRLLRDICNLEVQQYDLVVTDFEPISAWAAKRAGVPCVQLSHQAAFYSALTPRSSHRSPIQERIIRWFAPANYYIGFHYQQYDRWIEPPVIRESIRTLDNMNGNRVTVYMPSVHHRKLCEVLRQMPEVRWHVFAPQVNKAYREETVVVNPTSRALFTQSLERSFAVLSNAGFETTAEALYLKKKLMVLPIAGQYEQECNAAALQSLDVPILPSWSEQQISRIRQWLEHDSTPQSVDAADPDQLVRKVIQLGQQQLASNYRSSNQELGKVIASQNITAQVS